MIQYTKLYIYIITDLKIFLKSLNKYDKNAFYLNGEIMEDCLAFLNFWKWI